jgi:uncharacterized membrane protein
MNKTNFWSGFAAGTVAGVSAGLVSHALFRGRSFDSHILRLERSVQIAASSEQVFAAWSDLRDLARRISFVHRVDTSGNHSEWTVEVDGREFQFDAETTQTIPNQAIGWKSITGPKHTGRIVFAPLGSDTLVLVSMNYAPPLGRMSRIVAPITSHLESYIDQALRDFKLSLEGKAGEGTGNRSAARGPQSAGWDQNISELKATGTEGVRTMNPPGTPGTHTEYGGRVEAPGAVDYTRPPKDKY